jgi:hypothetical protein
MGVAGATGAQGPAGATGATGAQGPIGPTGLLTAGSIAGVTPYWNGSSWVVSSTNIYNNGGNVGVGMSTPISQLTVQDNTTLAGCRICRRWADNNGRASAAWTCTGLDVPNQLDFTGNVDNTDDLDLAISCPAATAPNFQICKRWADGDQRLQVSFTCVDFRTSDPTTGMSCATPGILCTDFVGDVNADDDFDVLIRAKTTGLANLTTCGIGVRWADNNGRANASWRYGSIGHVVRTDFQGGVDATDDLDFMLTCSIPYEDY